MHYTFEIITFWGYDGADDYDEGDDDDDDGAVKEIPVGHFTVDITV